MWRHKLIHPRYVYVYIPTKHLYLYIIQYKYIENKICIHITNVYTHTYYQKKYGKKYPWYSFSRMQPPRSNLKITEAGTSKDPGFIRFLAIFSELIKDDFLDHCQVPSFWNQKKTKDVVVELQKFQRLGSQKKLAEAVGVAHRELDFARPWGAPNVARCNFQLVPTPGTCAWDKRPSKRHACRRPLPNLAERLRFHQLRWLRFLT